MQLSQEDWKLLLLATIKDEWNDVSCWGIHVDFFPHVDRVKDKLKQMVAELIELEQQMTEEK